MHKIQQPYQIVLTGGPGMGKTSIITELATQGYTCIPEIGRQIIRQQMASQGLILPWKAPMSFAMAMYKQAVLDYQYYTKNSDNSVLFFDRGIPDVMGYLNLCGLKVPKQVYNSCRQYRYFKKVFLTPPWEEIYSNDTERTQTFSEAVATYEMMYQVYGSLGYTLIEIPKLTVAERSQFILTALGQ